MRYKGWVISKVYKTGSTFSINKDGLVCGRKPKPCDVEYYEIKDPMDNYEVWVKEFTLQQCKDTIDAFLEKVGMKSNKQEDWDKLK